MLTPLFPSRRSLWFVLILLSFNQAKGQVVVFSDDFTGNSDPARTISGNLHGNTSTDYRSAYDCGAWRKDSLQLPLPSLPSGFRHLTIRTDKHQYVKKLIIKGTRQ